MEPQHQKDLYSNYLARSRSNYQRKPLSEKAKDLAAITACVSFLSLPFGLKVAMDYSPTIKHYVMSVLENDKK